MCCHLLALFFTMRGFLLGSESWQQKNRTNSPWQSWSFGLMCNSRAVFGTTARPSTLTSFQCVFGRAVSVHIRAWMCICTWVRVEVGGQPQVLFLRCLPFFCFETGPLIDLKLLQAQEANWPVSSRHHLSLPPSHLAMAGITSMYHCTRLFMWVLVTVRTLVRQTLYWPSHLPSFAATIAPLLLQFYLQAKVKADPRPPSLRKLCGRWMKWVHLLRRKARRRKDRVRDRQREDKA